MSYSLNSLKGGYIGDYIGTTVVVTKGDTRSLDYSSCVHFQDMQSNPGKIQRKVKKRRERAGPHLIPSDLELYSQIPNSRIFPRRDLLYAAAVQIPD